MHKVLITVTRYIQRTGYQSSEMAQAGDYYFSTQAKAKAFCQQYVDKPLKWVPVGNFIAAEPSKQLSFIITQEADIKLDPVGRPALPTDFDTDPD